MTTNRVLNFADALRAQIATGLKPDGSPMGDLVALNLSMDLSAAEFFAFQNAQAQAHAIGVLTTDEAQTLYTALGGEYGGIAANGGWAPDADLALKVTVTNLIG